jgi:hypothetical protein
MSNSQIMGLVLIITGGYGIYLQTQNKLIPMLQIIVSKSDAKISFGKWIVALMLYLLAISFLQTREAFLLTMTIVIGALIYAQGGTK